MHSLSLLPNNCPKRSAAGQGCPLYITMSQFHHHQRSPWELLSAWGGLSPQLLAPIGLLAVQKKGLPSFSGDSSGLDGMLSIDRQHDLSSLPPSNIILLQLPGSNCGACYLELTKEGFWILMEAGPLAKRMAKQRDVILGLHWVFFPPIAAQMYFVESLLPNLTQSLLSELWFCCITNQPKTWWLNYPI